MQVSCSSSSLLKRNPNQGFKILSTLPGERFRFQNYSREFHNTFMMRFPSYMQDLQSKNKESIYLSIFSSPPTSAVMRGSYLLCLYLILKVNLGETASSNSTGIAHRPRTKGWFGNGQFNTSFQIVT